MLLIIDFGSQTTHLIGRRVRDLGVDCLIIGPEEALESIRTHKPQGIIFSGGPAFVHQKDSPTISPKIFSCGIPILGICYGWQLTAQLLRGKVIAGQKEYGPAQLHMSAQSPLLQGITAQDFQVWMSHGDEVIKLPKGFEYLASTPDVRAAVVADSTRQIYGVQFHPEVEHTQHGTVILRNFIENICSEKIQIRAIDVEKIIAAVRDKANATGTSSRAIAAVSGGVDSTVASALVAKAIGKRFTPLYCDNGLMRVGTTAEVEHIFTDLLGVKPSILDCKEVFLEALRGKTDPEHKRIAIGNLYIRLFEQEARKLPDVKFLVQGTIYSDVIESKGTKHASKIKSHHNVGGLPADMKLELLEPVRELYKDEVREVGRQLGLPEAVLMKQPFPGPGQAIRILGEVTAERLAKQQQADQIVLEVLQKMGWYEKVFQSFPILSGALTTAVKGDGRVYGELVGLRVYDSSDIMTAGWTHLPYEVLQKISSRIVNEVPGVSRVAYDITTKPPATMEWE